ncbi:ABC-type hemin transport system substrate-binding protein [Nitrobacter vulgaris]|uniref:hypothetical protein n=1 Tax=Nitrobacter vulgaris TaxID=29421 RepID=UPI0028619B1C|nr:hypothetical protein [Nitrobacter vulgaris]MDR6306085.1 ABC-type hemin transport system substrate-binding protein [Nitrobacter vulgaris]
MMQQYSIHKTGKQYVVQAKGKDLLICESRREAEHIISGVATTAETSVSQARPLTAWMVIELQPQLGLLPMPTFSSR